MSGRPLLLDLFCGAGGAAVGYHRAGFDVIGIDHEDQPNYPFVFYREDALGFLARHGKDFDAVHASPPCQRYTVGRHIHQSGDRHPDLVAPTRELLAASGRPWVIENVPGSPLESPAVLCGLMFGLKVIRHRMFETSFPLDAPPHPRHPRGNLTNAGSGYSSGYHDFVCVAGNNFVRTAGARAMRIDWMRKRPELAQAIPPAYTEWVGRFLLAAVRNAHVGI